MDKLYQSIYSRYYKIVQSILSEAVKRSLTKTDVLSIVRRQAFLETEYFIMPKLLKEDGYKLLYKNNQETYDTVVNYSPIVAITNLERSWLAAVLMDPKTNLFLSEALFSKLQAELVGVTPLFSVNEIEVVDTFNQAFDFNNVVYKQVFSCILKAFRQRMDLNIYYESKKGNRLNSLFRPIELVYEHKADKFQLVAVGIKYKRGKRFCFNLEDIAKIECAERNEGIDVYLNTPKQASVTFKIYNTRNAFERSFFQFSAYKTKTTYDEATGVSTVKLYYMKAEENEILIHLISYGIALNVIEPPEFVEKIKSRLQKQKLICRKFSD